MCAHFTILRRWRMRAIFYRTAPWWICVEQRCCGALLKASSTLPRKSTWRHSGRRSMQRAPSALWVSIPSPSPACTGVVPFHLWKTSSLGCTWRAVTCTVTTTGATVRSRRPTLSESVPCAGWWGPTCHCGWAASRPSTWTQVHPHTPSCHADMCVQRSRSSTGQRSLCPTVLTPSTQPAPFAPPNLAQLRAIPS